jgi:hypothetical protein
VNAVVVGSYPPVPGPAAAATLAAVRAAWTAGDDVLVVSPRATAADRRAHLRGWWAAAALARLSRRRQHLVLVAEPGMPFGAEADRRAAAALARVARTGYGSFDLWLVDPARLPVSPLARLWPAADRVVVATETDRDAAVSHLGVAVSRIAIDPTARPLPSRAELPAAGVTPFGPVDWTGREQPRRVASVVIRRILGSRTDTVRAQVVRVLNGGRRARQAARQRLDRIRSRRREPGPRR